MFKPKSLLYAEGAMVLLAACIVYHRLHGSWLRFALFFLTPDLFMLGYLVNKRLGATIYNLVHNYAVPLLLLSVFLLAGQISYVWPVLIWFAHIGMDRMLGYGLKYETAFKDTHLQRI
jgi:Domain of unknown function (DUF4260)